MARLRRNLSNLLSGALNRRSGLERAAGSPIDRTEIQRLLRLMRPAGEAHERGLRLLKENLSPVQRAQYEKRGYFIVIGGETGTRYRISNGCQMNVEQLNKRGKPIRGLCFLPEGDLVDGDVMLAQKLALELFESEALKVAREFPAGF